MKASREVLDNGKGYVRETGWNHRGFMLLVEPDTEGDRLVAYGRKRLQDSSLLTFFGDGVTQVARQGRWNLEKLEENPDLLKGLFVAAGNNLIVMEGITTELHDDQRNAATIFHEPLPILEITGVRLPVETTN